MLFYKTSVTRRESSLFQSTIDRTSPNELIMSTVKIHWRKGGKNIKKRLK